MDETKAELWGKAIGSLVVGLLIAAIISIAFSLTFYQGLVLSWLYCMMKNAVEHQKT